jgi:hypothetical protein
MPCNACGNPGFQPAFGPAPVSQPAYGFPGQPGFGRLGLFERDETGSIVFAGMKLEELAAIATVILGAVTLYNVMRR